MNYKALLENSYQVEKETSNCAPESRLEYLGDHIFHFTAYDGEMSRLFGRKAVEVCAAISGRTTFDYIKDPENYRWFLLMCNMPFFSDKLNWGTSIRGAWWDTQPGRQFELESCGLWDGDDQLTDTLKLDAEEWRLLIAAIVDFAISGEAE